MTAEALGIFLDYSKNRVTDETLKLLLQLAKRVADGDEADAEPRRQRRLGRQIGAHRDPLCHDRSTQLRRGLAVERADAPAQPARRKGADRIHCPVIPPRRVPVDTAASSWCRRRRVGSLNRDN